MDVQQIVALAVVAAAAALLVRRYVAGRRKPKFGQCADCVAASTAAAGKPAAVSRDEPAGHPGGDRRPDG